MPPLSFENKTYNISFKNIEGIKMNELKCQECKKIIGFSNKDFIHENKKYPTKIRCIECEFRYSMTYFEGLTKK